MLTISNLMVLAVLLQDTTVVRVGAPLHPGTATVVEDLQIGLNAPTRDYEFISVYGLTAGPDGSIFVVDRGTPGPSVGAVVRKFDANGKFVRNFGRSGQGPGEYTTPVDVDLHRDGRVLVLDPRNGRINVYAPDGSVLPAWQRTS